MKRTFKKRKGTLDLGVLGLWAGKINATSIFGIPVPKRSAADKVNLTPSQSQQLHTMKFALATEFAGKICEVANIGFGLVVKRTQMSGINRLVQHLMSNAIVGNINNVSIKFYDVAVSEGDIFPLRFAWIKLVTIGMCKLNWKNEYSHWDEDKEIRESDRIYVVIYNETRGQVLKSGFVGQRSDEQATFEVIPFHQDDELHCWIFAKSLTTKEVSCSLYVADLIKMEDKMTVVL